MTPWHRLLGLVMTDFFSGSPFRVTMEKDLSERQKFLDILLIEGEGTAWQPELCPDGLEPGSLRRHNLISFKSFQESFTADAVEHLTSCVADYRYLVQAEKRPHGGPELLPNDQLQTIAVTAKYPRKLASKLGSQCQTTQHEGVYEMKWGTRSIRVIVCRRVELAERNALWLLFSGQEECVAFAMKHFGLNNHDMSTILSRISETYQLQGLNMPYTVEDFKRECIEEVLEEIKELPEAEQQRFLAHLPPDLRLKGLDPKELMVNFDPKDRLEGLDPKDRLEGLSKKELEELRKLIDGEDAK